MAQSTAKRLLAEDQATPRPGRPRKPVEIPLDKYRAMLLKSAGYTHDGLANRIERMDSVRIARPTVSAVIAGKFENELVIKHFCDVTGTKRSEIFPPKADDAE